MFGPSEERWIAEFDNHIGRDWHEWRAREEGETINNEPAVYLSRTKASEVPTSARPPAMSRAMPRPRRRRPHTRAWPPS